jgi:hypothetical protein
MSPTQVGVVVRLLAARVVTPTRVIEVRSARVITVLPPTTLTSPIDCNNALYRDSRLEYLSLPDALHGSYEWVRPRLSLRLSVIAPTNTSSGYFYLARSGDFYLGSISVIYLNIHYANSEPFSAELAALNAARLTLAEFDDLAAERKDFAFESTLSGRTYTSTLRIWENGKVVAKDP